MRDIHVRKLSISVIQLDVDFMRVSCDDRLTETICPEMLRSFPFCIIISSFGSHFIMKSLSLSDGHRKNIKWNLMMRKCDKTTSQFSDRI